ncbi:MAG: phenylacetate--CoA ligase family protein [Anaerolineales bacterium]|nr:phenylacetate--CoA ligase family protein [Anaerolineales bacterium]
MANLTDKIYTISPVWLQQAMVSAYGWRWRRRRFGGEFASLRQEFIDRDGWTSEQFHAYQEERLDELLRAAWNSPYYRRVFEQAGIRPGMPPFDALAALPPLSKETLRKRAGDLLTEKPPKGTVVFNSSGTTGTPTDIYYTTHFHQLATAVAAVRNLGWGRVAYNGRRVMFGVRKVCHFSQNRPPFWRFSPAEDLAYASIYHLSTRFLPYYLDFLRSYQPDIIMGYPSALRAVANYALRHQDFPAPAKGVFTHAETLLAQDRQAIEATWRCKIYDRYGAVENCVFAAQCEYGSYHVSPEVGIVEIVDDQGNHTPPGVMGEVICTGLQNTLQPLIRYRIGDVARWATEQKCACGHSMPIIEAVDGRIEDICYTPDGREMLRFDTVFKGIANLREAQVVQEELDRFSILVVATDEFDEGEAKKIEHNMHLHVGEVKVEIKQVADIPRTRSGKFRAVLCKLPEEIKAAIKHSSR